MTVVAQRVTVATTATRLDATGETDYQVGQSLLVRNRGAVSVYVGGSNVTTATGFELEAGDSVPIDLAPGDAFYGIVASGTAVCHVIQVGV